MDCLPEAQAVVISAGLVEAAVGQFYGTRAGTVRCNDLHDAAIRRGRVVIALMGAKDMLAALDFAMSFGYEIAVTSSKEANSASSNDYSGAARDLKSLDWHVVDMDVDLEVGFQTGPDGKDVL